MKSRSCPICNEKNFNVIIKEMNFCASIAHLRVSQDSPIMLKKFKIVCCHRCKFVFNSLLDDTDTAGIYTDERYVLKKNISSEMNSHMINLVDKILIEFSIKHKKLKDARYLEIGAGAGEMAMAFLRKGFNVTTFDPSLTIDIEGIKHVKNYFNLKNVNEYAVSRQYDLVNCRHVLEHVTNPLLFLKDIYEICNDETLVYIEVPNFDEIIKSKRFYDLFIDHFGYYTETVFKILAFKTGFDVLSTHDLYSSQHKGYFLQKAKQSFRLDFSESKSYVYNDNIFTNDIRDLNNALGNIDDFALWGAGAHGNSILMYLDNENRNKCKIVFDKDPDKSGKYMAGANIQVVFPTRDNVNECNLLIASALHRAEIEKELINNYENVNFIAVP